MILCVRFVPAYFSKVVSHARKLYRFSKLSGGVLRTVVGSYSQFCSVRFL